VVAYSGGVDSSVVAAVAHRIWGEDMLAVTLKSPSTPTRELESAKKIAREIGFPHQIVKHNELECDELRSNPEDRCFYCKKILSQRMQELACEKGFDVVLEGTSRGDLRGHRPGYEALKESKDTISPLVEAGYTKKEVRQLARELTLSNWDMPSTACLSSRIPYGREIREEELQAVDEAEEFIRNLGVGQVRVRHHGDRAHIEVDSKDMQLVLEERKRINNKLGELGFEEIYLDLQGYQTR